MSIKVVALAKAAAATLAFANVITPAPSPSIHLPRRNWMNESTSTLPTRHSGCTDSCVAFRPTFTVFSWSAVTLSDIVYADYGTTITEGFDPGTSYTWTEVITSNRFVTNEAGTLICEASVTVWDPKSESSLVTNLAYRTQYVAYESTYSWHGTYATSVSEKEGTPTGVCTTVTSPLDGDTGFWATPIVTLSSSPMYKAPIINTDIRPGSGTVEGAVYTCIPLRTEIHSEFLKTAFAQEDAFRVCEIGFDGGNTGAGALFPQSIVTDAGVGMTMALAPAPNATPSVPGTVALTVGVLGGYKEVPHPSVLAGPHQQSGQRQGDHTVMPNSGHGQEPSVVQPGGITITPDATHLIPMTLTLLKPGSSTVIPPPPSSPPNAPSITVAVNTYAQPVLPGSGQPGPATASEVITEVTIISGLSTSSTIVHPAPTPAAMQTANVIYGSVVFTLVSVTSIISIAASLIPGLGATETITEGHKATAMSAASTMHTLVMTMDDGGKSILVIDGTQTVVLPTGTGLQAGASSIDIGAGPSESHPPGGEGSGARLGLSWDIWLLVNVAFLLLVDI